MTADERLAHLEAENAWLREQLTVVVPRVQELEARLAKDSHNSGKKPGGQLGLRGETLRLVATPDVVVEHRPAVCEACRLPLDTRAPVVLRERRQVQDLPPLRLWITERQALHVQCPACRAVSAGVFPREAPSRAQYGPRLRALAVHLVEQQLVPYARARAVFADLFGASLSRGTLVQWIQRAAQALAPVETAAKQTLARVPVLHIDETGGCGGQGRWRGRMSRAPCSSLITRCTPSWAARPSRRLASCPATTVSASMTAGNRIRRTRPARMRSATSTIFVN